MRLRLVGIRGFRCFRTLEGVPVENLAVLIGANDAGKTAFADAIEILLTPKLPLESDYWEKQGEASVPEITIEGTFDLEAGDSVPAEFQGRTGQFRLSKSFTPGASACRIQGLRLPDDRMSTFDKLKLGEMQEVMAGQGLSIEGTRADLSKCFQEALAGGVIARTPDWVNVKFQEIKDHLPLFQKICSTDYNHPDAIIRVTLEAVAHSALNPLDPTTGQPSPLPQLLQVKETVSAAVQAKIAEMETTLRSHHPRIAAISASPTLNFARSVTSVPLLVDMGDGLKQVDAHGEGTKKKLWMGLLAWQRAVEKAVPRASVFRIYDEPDVNLDYEAERLLFSTILEAATKDNSGIQTLVCTHAVSMVDRAPAGAINLLHVAADGARSVVNLKAGATDADLREFLEEIGRASGISNSALFYEKAFLVVEGESEENALPILYRKVFGRSMIEDGIVLVPLQGSGAWKAMLKLLRRNKENITIMLLDSDCQSPGASGHITPDSLAQIGFGPAFLQANVFHTGAEEFEDSFSSAIIAATLNRHFPKPGGAWAAAEIDVLRPPRPAGADKFAKALRILVQQGHQHHIGKPVIARRIAECCAAPDVPPTVRAALERVRQAAGHTA